MEFSGSNTGVGFHMPSGDLPELGIKPEACSTLQVDSIPFEPYLPCFFQAYERKISLIWFVNGNNKRLRGKIIFQDSPK